MNSYYDVVIGGGSIAGLFAAREVASHGFSVLVLEEDHEIGTPEHCGGLVSLSALQKLKVIPSSQTLLTKIKSATIKSRSNQFTIDATNQNVIVIDRRSFDKQIAFLAQKEGAVIRTLARINKISFDSYHYHITSSDGNFSCKYFIDAKGISSLIKNNREGILQSAQYEIYAPWIQEDSIEVFFDSDLFPGFFGWVISSGPGRGKVGVAGRSINAMKSLLKYLSIKGEGYSIIRKIFAPIWVNGPISQFIVDQSVVVGDAAGQSKPTTAGGIYTCGMGGIHAGKAVAESISSKSNSLLFSYPKNWNQEFKNEFDKMLLARKVLERLDNKAIDDLFAAISQSNILIASERSDFDFHSNAITKLLSSTTGLKIAKTILGNEFRRLFQF